MEVIQGQNNLYLDTDAAAAGASAGAVAGAAAAASHANGETEKIPKHVHS